MAHFAKLDENNFVLEVLVLDNYMITVNGIEIASLGLAVEATEFPLYVPYGIELSEMSDRDGSATTLPSGIVVACELACHYTIDRQRHCYINHSRWSRDGGVTTSERYVLQQRRYTQLAGSETTCPECMETPSNVSSRLWRARQWYWNSFNETWSRIPRNPLIFTVRDRNIRNEGQELQYNNLATRKSCCM
jgi:hypothetical protein